jgi:hypothetical protein
MNRDNLTRQHAAINATAVNEIQAHVPVEGSVDDGFGIADDYQPFLSSFVDFIQDSIGDELE